MNIDHIANLISIINNGYQAGLKRVVIDYSKEKEKILETLKKEKYLKNLKTIEKDKKKTIQIRLLYIDELPAINFIKRISKPGRRIYAKPTEFKQVLAFGKTKRDYGSTIVSTSKGVMTTKEAKKKNIGGELILKVY